MNKVGLICAAGITSQTIITQVKLIIKKNNLDLQFLAINVDEVDDSFKLILLTPQVEYLKKKVIEIIGNNKIIVEVIPSVIYANNNIEELIKLTNNLLKK